MMMEIVSGNELGTGARATVVMLLGGEVTAMVTDMRWGLILIVLLVLADFRFGWGESAKRYKEAKKAGDKAGMEAYRWHTSRAVRRTANKFVDYLVLMLVGGSIGMAILEPIGVSHVFGCWAGAVTAMVCELFSIGGHFFYLRGVKVEEKNIRGFVRAFVVAMAKKKDEDVGEALGQAFEEGEKE